MFIRTTPPSSLLAGDLVSRPKKSGWGCHYGTGLHDGRVAHTTPERGKHISTLEEFAEGFPVTLTRPSRTQMENYEVQQRALADLGRPYAVAASNCERDVTRTHNGIPSSPMVQSVLVGLSVGALIGLVKYSKDLGLR